MYKHHFGPFVFCAVILFFALPTLAGASTNSYVRIFYYRDSSLAEQALFKHSNQIDVLAPQGYMLDGAGVLTGSTSPIVLAFAKEHGVKVMPVVTDSSFTASAYQALLTNPRAQNAAIISLVAEAKKNGYWGWQIDFEPMDASYRDQFSAFIAKTAAALQQNSLVASVAVAAKTSDNSADYPAQYWQNVAGAYDYTALASSTNFVSVMAYDDPNSAGPVVEYPWLTRVLTYSLAHIPSQKISLGIPLYYWQWNTRTGTRVDIGGNEKMTALLAAHSSVQFYYSAFEQEPFFRYQNNIVWYENGRSVGQKIALVQGDNLYGFSAWRLGLETPSVYAEMREN